MTRGVCRWKLFSRRMTFGNTQMERKGAHGEVLRCRGQAGEHECTDKW